MIIECKNCQKQFVLNDNVITDKGRTVQCSNCSTQWFQMPVSSTVNTPKSEVDDGLPENELEEQIDEIITSNKVRASDGKTYKFMGRQWAILLPSGKTGKLAKKKISLELNKKTGRKEEKRLNKKIEIPASKGTTQIYSEKDKDKGIGLFSFLIVLIMFFAAIILALDTFKHLIIPFWPKLDSYLVYIYETLNNIFIIIKDLFNNYK